MATGAAVVGAAGLGLQIYGQEKARQEQADQLRSEADARRFQAQELLRRGGIQLKNISLKGKQVIGEQAAIFASKGFDIGTGSSLDVMEETQRKLVDRLFETEKEIRFQSNSILSGAASLEQAAARTLETSKFETASTLFSGGSRLFLASGGGIGNGGKSAGKDPLAKTNSRTPAF